MTPALVATVEAHFASRPAGYSVPYVMQQVGHRDPRTTMSIYAKVCARRDRSMHHAAFDKLVAGAPVLVPPADQLAVVA